MLLQPQPIAMRAQPPALTERSGPEKQAFGHIVQTGGIRQTEDHMLRDYAA